MNTQSEYNDYVVKACSVELLYIFMHNLKVCLLCFNYTCHMMPLIGSSSVQSSSKSTYKPQNLPSISVFNSASDMLLSEECNSLTSGGSFEVPN